VTDNRYNANRGDAFREGFRRIFGGRDVSGKSRTGKWVMTDKGLVPVEEYKKPKSGLHLRVRDKTTEFEFHRVRKDMRHEVHNEGGYRTI